MLSNVNLELILASFVLPYRSSKTKILPNGLNFSRPLVSTKNPWQSHPHRLQVQYRCVFFETPRVYPWLRGIPSASVRYIKILGILECFDIWDISIRINFRKRTPCICIESYTSTWWFETFSKGTKTRDHGTTLSSINMWSNTTAISRNGALPSLSISTAASCPCSRRKNSGALMQQKIPGWSPGVTGTYVEGAIAAIC